MEEENKELEDFLDKYMGDIINDDFKFLKDLLGKAQDKIDQAYVDEMRSRGIRACFTDSKGVTK